MVQTLTGQIAGLRRMTPGQLREKYLQIFGEPTRSGNKDFLAKRLAWRLQSLAEGSLSERARRRAEELARDADIRITLPRPPKVAAMEATRCVVKPAPAVAGDDRLPLPGTILTRQYRGQLIQVTVLPKGFEYQGQIHRTLIPNAPRLRPPRRQPWGSSRMARRHRSGHVQQPKRSSPPMSEPSSESRRASCAAGPASAARTRRI